MESQSGTESINVISLTKYLLLGSPIKMWLLRSLAWELCYPTSERSF